jgi:hypothetical protein
MIHPAMFDECPVWASDDDDNFIAVHNRDPLPEDLGNLFIKVDFVTPGGVHLAGCVTAPARHYAAIFAGSEVFHFNAALRPSDLEVDRLNRLLPELDGKIFPLQYESIYRFANDLAVAGSFAVRAK